MQTGVTFKGKNRPTAGFSYLELLAVLALLALILGLVVPGFRQSLKKEKVRAGMRQFAATLRAARGAAATQSQRRRVLLDLDTGYYGLEGSLRQGRLPPGIRIADAHLVWKNPGQRQGYIDFYSDGSSSGGYLAIFSSNGQRYTIEVEIITGRVNLGFGD
jgi:general secretion pathway protein H